MADRFYVMRVKYLKDGTRKKSELMDYATQKEAETKFYKNTGDDMADSTLNGSVNVVLNSIGGDIDCKFWADDPESIEDRYFVVRVKDLKDGTIKKSELMDYATSIEASSKFYTNIGTDMSDDTLAGSMCTVLDIKGSQTERKYWYIEEPAPEE